MTSSASPTNTVSTSPRRASRHLRLAGPDPRVGEVTSGAGHPGLPVAELRGAGTRTTRTRSPSSSGSRARSAFLADLSRGVPDWHPLDFVILAGYGRVLGGHAESPDRSRISTAHAARDVVIVDPVVDTDLTLNYLVKTFGLRRAMSAVSLLLRSPVSPTSGGSAGLRYVGFTVPDEYFVGYNFDLEGVIAAWLTSRRSPLVSPAFAGERRVMPLNPRLRTSLRSAPRARTNCRAGRRRRTIPTFPEPPTPAERRAFRLLQLVWIAVFVLAGHSLPRLPLADHELGISHGSGCQQLSSRAGRRCSMCTSKWRWQPGRLVLPTAADQAWPCAAEPLPMEMDTTGGHAP